MEKSYKELLEEAAKKILKQYIETGKIDEIESRIVSLYSDIYRFENDKSFEKLLSISSISSNLTQNKKENLE